MVEPIKIQKTVSYCYFNIIKSERERASKYVCSQFMVWDGYVPVKVRIQIKAWILTVNESWYTSDNEYRRLNVIGYKK